MTTENTPSDARLREIADRSLGARKPLEFTYEEQVALARAELERRATPQPKAVERCTQCGACSAKEAETKCTQTQDITGEYTCAGSGLWEQPPPQQPREEPGQAGPSADEVEQWMLDAQGPRDHQRNDSTRGDRGAWFGVTASHLTWGYEAMRSLRKALDAERTKREAAEELARHNEWRVNNALASLDGALMQLTAAEATAAQLREELAAVREAARASFKDWGVSTGIPASWSHALAYFDRGIDRRLAEIAAPAAAGAEPDPDDEDDGYPACQDPEMDWIEWPKPEEMDVCKTHVGHKLMHTVCSLCLAEMKKATEPRRDAEEVLRETCDALIEWSECYEEKRDDLMAHAKWGARWEAPSTLTVAQWARERIAALSQSPRGDGECDATFLPGWLSWLNRKVQGDLTCGTDDVRSILQSVVRMTATRLLALEEQVDALRDRMPGGAK